MEEVSAKTLRKRRSSIVVVILLIILGLQGVYFLDKHDYDDTTQQVLSSEDIPNSELAINVLEELEVKGRAPKTGYARDEFGSGWASYDGCDTRNIILKRDLSDINLSEDECVVLNGILQDPYTAETIDFIRGTNTSEEVQIDHVVALSDAWQKGAQNMDFGDRVVFANDPLNLLAVDGPTNQEKGNSDAASWLPPNKAYRCRYVARQISVKKKYILWITEAEKSAMKRVLNSCSSQPLPVESYE